MAAGRLCDAPDAVIKRGNRLIDNRQVGRILTEGDSNNTVVRPDHPASDRCCGPAEHHGNGLASLR